MSLHLEYELSRTYTSTDATPLSQTAVYSGDSELKAAFTVLSHIASDDDEDEEELVKSVAIQLTLPQDFQVCFTLNVTSFPSLLTISIGSDKNDDWPLYQSNTALLDCSQMTLPVSAVLIVS